MKTPAEVAKESFWIGARGGLVDRKHYCKMGDAVWLFLYLLRSQTGLNQRSEGIVNYGHALTFRRIGDEMKGFPPETIRRWAATLRRGNYIRTGDRGHAGLVFWIAKGKAKTRKVKVTQEEARIMHKSAQKLQRASRADVNAKRIPHRADVNVECVAHRADLNAERLPKKPQAPMSEAFAGICDSSTPKGSTSESLSYYNKDAAAQTAAGVFSLLKHTAREMQIPQRKSAAELDATRRELLGQVEEITRNPKYLPGQNPGVKSESASLVNAG
jgi:hypothetical protein